MPPKQKAEEIFYKMLKYSFGSQEKSALFQAKQCALATTDEILYALSVPPIQNKGHLLYDGQIDYWQQVKQEIEKL